MSGSVTLLCVGGPQHGNWVERPANERVWYAAVIPDLHAVTWKDYEDAPVEELRITQAQYTKRVIADKAVFVFDGIR